MKYKNLGAILLAGVSATTLAASAFAQENAEAKPADDSTVVVVTGSRVITSINKSPTPITTVTNETLQTVQPGTIADGLNTLPVFSGSRNQYSNPGAGATGVQGGNGSANVLNLRNLGANRTLVLYDGHRIPPTLFNSAVDVDLIPQDLIRNVDVVTGGVSAVYGSDAVSGVVNFVPNRNFNGLKGHAAYGISERGDNITSNIGVAGGGHVFNDRGHIEASYEYRKNDGILSRATARDWLNLASTAGGGTAANPYYVAQDVRNKTASFGGLIRSGGLSGQSFNTDGVLSPFDAGATSNSSCCQIGGDGTYDDQSMSSPLKSQQLYARFDYDFSDNLHGYLVGAANIKTNLSYTGYATLNNVTLDGTNAFLPDIYEAGAGTSFKFSKAFQNLRRNIASVDTKQYYFNGGLEGRIGDNTRWELNLTHGDAQLNTDNPTDINNLRLAAALDAVDDGSGHIVCKASLYNSAFSNCIPLNPFGPTATTQAMLDYVQGDAYMDSQTVMDAIDASISGAPFSTWAGPVNVALSGEWRNVSFETSSNVTADDKADCASLGYVSPNCTVGLTAYQASFANLDKVNQSVGEAALEFDAPLLVDKAFAQSLNLNGAVRYTSYSTSGNYTTWKLGIDWHVNDQLRFRATDSQDIRAPTLYDLFQPAVTVPLNNFVDPLTGHTLSSVPSINEGNPDLTAELGHTLTAGVVWRPSFLSGATFTLDGYYIKIKNAVTTVQGWNLGQSLCDQSGGASIACSTIDRPGGPTNAGADATAFYAKAFNLASVESYGMDIEADYTHTVFGRQFNGRLMMNYQPHIYYYQFGGKTDQGGVAWGGGGLTAAPAFTLTAFINYRLTDKITIDLLERYRNKMRESAKQLHQVWADPYVDAYSTTNVTLSYDLGKALHFGDSSAFVTVENLFDQDPPLSTNRVQAGGGYYGYVDNPVGRMFTIGIRIKN